MNIGLIDCDKTKFPNLALMKLSAWHRAQGDQVELTDPIWAGNYDKIYASKVFTWTPAPVLPESAVMGGTGFDISVTLPEEIENTCPDYSLYPRMDYSMGFLTRGCIRRCPWCFVPKKEGKIRPAVDIEDFLRHDKAVLLDNNVLAHEHGIRQIEKIAELGVRVDFNQGLDARLIDNSVAKLLARVKWLNPVRLACDTKEIMSVIYKAVELLRWHNVTPRRYSCYVLINEDIKDALERIRFLKGIYVDPFAQPYISPDGKTPTELQRKLARYVNHKAVFNSVTWDEYQK